MRKNKLAALLCAGLFLTSCSHEPSNPGVAVQEKEEELVIGVCIYDFQDDFMSLYRKELEKYLDEEYGVRTEFLDGQGKEEVQTRQLKELLEKEPDAVILNPVEASRVSAMVDMCAKKEIPAVIINREPPEEEMERWKEEKLSVCYIGTDRTQAGTYQGEIILDTSDRGDINGDGKISCVMITGDGRNPEAWYRREYARRAMEKAGFAVDILFERSGNWQEEEGERLASLALSLWGEEAEVIFCGNDAMAIGAERALKRAGRRVGRDIYLTGVDGLREAVALVEKGKMTGTVWNDYKTQAHMAADSAVSLTKGEKQDIISRASYIKIVMGE